MPENPRKKLPKSVCDKREEKKLIYSKLAHLEVKASDPKYLRTVTVQGTGLFQCGNCSRIWSSHRSRAKVDLVNFCLLDTENRQGCRECKLPMSLWPAPCFKECWFEEILDKVVTKYNMRKASNGQRFINSGGHIANGSSRRQHYQNLCEKCITSESPCWQSV